MSKISLIIDAWIREAEEASRWVEDLESRTKHENFPHSNVVDYARSKLFELGMRMDRLESLLLNPPAKPVLTDEDLEFRWKMLKDIQMRTRALACSLYAVPSPNRPRNSPVADTKECSSITDCYDQDLTKTSSSQDDSELQKSLLSDVGSRNQVWKACFTIFLLLGLAALLFFVILLCTFFL